MSGKGLLTVAGRFVVVILGLGVLGWVWTQSESSERPPTAKTWIGQLQARDADDRKNAVLELSNTGAADVASVTPALIGALGDPDASVRFEAALALGHCLAAALKVRGAGLTELSRTALTALMAVLERDGDLSVRGSAASAAAELVGGLADAGVKPDQSKTDDPIDPRTMAKAFNAALERNPATRVSVLVPYRRLGPLDEPAPRALLAALDDPSRVVRIQALKVLAQFSSGVDEVVPVLLKEAEIKDPKVWPSVFRVGYPIRQAAEQLHPTPAVVPMLITGLESQNPEVRSVAVVLLGRLGPDARSAAPALITATKAIIRSSQGSTKHSEEPDFSNLASTIVQVLPTDEALAILREALSPGHYATQADAAFALGKLGPRGYTAVPILLQALEDAGKPSTGPVREGDAYAVIWSLQRIAPEAPLSQAMADEVVEALCKSLDFPKESVRTEAANTLGEFAHRASAALPRLRALRASEKEPKQVRDAAAEAIEMIEEKPGGS